MWRHYSFTSQLVITETRGELKNHKNSPEIGDAGNQRESGANNAKPPKDGDTFLEVDTEAAVGHLNHDATWSAN